MIDQILKCLCILSGVTFLFKRLPLLINKLMNQKMLYLLLGCFILYILYSVYKKWKKEKITETFDSSEEKKEINIKEILVLFETKLEKRFDSFEEKIINILQENTISFEERLLTIFEERLLTILQENRSKGKKKN